MAQYATMKLIFPDKKDGGPEDIYAAIASLVKEIEAADFCAKVKEVHVK